MLPINDSEPNRYGSFPLMTLTLIAINTLILVWELSLPKMQLYVVFYFFGFTPSMIWAREGAGMLSALTSTFLHGGISHLLGNMLFLWVFGRRVEDACGPGRFLLYYLLSGCTACLTIALAQPKSEVPCIGASGAIFGITSAYLLLFPGGRIRTLWIIAIIPTWPKIRAFWILVYYLLIQIPPAVDIYLHGARYGVAYWGHLGGFFACIFILLFLKPQAFARYMSNVSV